MVERKKFYKQKEREGFRLYDRQMLGMKLEDSFKQLNLEYGNIPACVEQIKEVLVRADLSYVVPPNSDLALIGGGSGTAAVGRSLYRTGITSFTMLANTGEMGRDRKTGLPLGGGMIFEEIPQAIDCMDILKQAIHATPEENKSNLHHLLNNERGLFMKLGYLVFEALRDLSDDPQAAIDFLNSWMRNPYRVVPSTVDRTELYLSMRGEELGCNQYWLRQDPKIVADHPVMKPNVHISAHAQEVISSASTFIVGPGDVFFSVLPHWGIEGFSEEMRANYNSRIILIANLTARERDITGFKLTDYLDLYARFLPADRAVTVVVNIGEIPAEDPLIDNIEGQDNYRNYTLVRADIGSNNVSGNKQLIHDEAKLGNLLRELISPS